MPKTKPTLDERFCKCEVLGEGGNGTVYKAFDKRTSQEVALKHLQKGGTEKKHRFLDEIRIMQEYSTSVDGIIPILDSSTEDYWYTMPIADPISHYIESAKPSAEEIVAGIIQLSQTLTELHNENISHRDIKPDNILFYQGRYCLTDFGLASISDDSCEFTKSDKPLGAIFTIAPEMKRDPKNADGKKADVYSIAKTLWMLLTGDNKGFDGVYNSFDKNHSLRFIPDLSSIHLVELEELLTDATNNDPSLRPDMIHFTERLSDWIIIEKDFERAQISEWNYISHYLFGTNTPMTAIWNNQETIIRILNAVGSLRAFNHMLLPDGGGLDFFRAEKTAEDGCICIIDTLGYYHIVKPQSLCFEAFESAFEWNYFQLNLTNLKPISKESSFRFRGEVLIEDYPGHYIYTPDAVYHVYDYDSGDPLPEGSRSVTRYLSGSILIVLKMSPYNDIPETYDGRHSKYNNKYFREYIETLKVKYDFLLSCGIDSESAAHMIGRVNRDDEEKTAIWDQKAEPHGFVMENYHRWSFQEYLEESCSGSIEFTFVFQLQNGGSFSEILSRKDKYLCSDGYIREEPDDVDIYRVHDRDIAHRVKAFCDEHICHLCEQAGFSHPGPGEYVFHIQLKRIGSPTHLFTKDEITQLMKEADDRKDNMLVIDENGYPRMIQEINLGHLYPVRLESWDARNNYVGKYSNLSNIDDVYLLALQGWLSYLQTGHKQYSDYIQTEQTDINSLIVEIKKYY